MIAPIYELLRDNEPLVSAQQAPFVNRYTVTRAGREWTLKAEEMLAKRFGLFDGDARVGGITPSSPFNFTRDVTIDLPDELPLEAHVFLMWLLLWKWGDTSHFPAESARRMSRRSSPVRWMFSRPSEACHAFNRRTENY